MTAPDLPDPAVTGRDFEDIYDEHVRLLAEDRVTAVSVNPAALRKVLERYDAARAELAKLRDDIAYRQDEKEITLHIQDEYSTALRAMARRLVDRRKKVRFYMREMLRAKDEIKRIGQAAGEPLRLGIAPPGTPEYTDRIIAAVLNVRSEAAMNSADFAELERLRAVTARLAELEAENADLVRQLAEELKSAKEGGIAFSHTLGAVIRERDEARAELERVRAEGHTNAKFYPDVDEDELEWVEPQLTIAVCAQPQSHPAHDYPTGNDGDWEGPPAWHCPGVLALSDVIRPVPPTPEPEDGEGR